MPVNLERLQSQLSEISNTFLASFAGFLTGIVLFFNHSHFMIFISSLVTFTLIGAVSGYAYDRWGKKAFLLTAILLVIYLFYFLTGGCLAYLPQEYPQENMFTGEVDSYPWDGFRLEACEKQELPWYYTEVTGEKEDRLCSMEKWNSTIWCMDHNNVAGEQPTEG